MKFFSQNSSDKDFRRAKQSVLILVANLILFFSLYYLLPKVGFYYLPFIYIIGGGILAMWYVIYNRGFRTRNKTPDMLPEELSLTEREDMIADGKRRMENSRWALMILLPLIAVILIDYIYLAIPEAWLS